jgi:methylated-DNA-[protein]-cysteine S-methyltransferase
MEHNYLRMQTPAGEITIYAGSTAVTGLFLGNIHKKSLSRKYEQAIKKDNDILLMARDQLESYFAGDLKKFTVPLEINGTGFQKAVWQVLLNIGYGELMTYAEVAKRIGNPRACRAAGAAIGSNPVSIIIPCHRIIGSDATLTGFGGGLSAKQHLLETEGHSIENFKCSDSQN